MVWAAAGWSEHDLCSRKAALRRYVTRCSVAPGHKTSAQKIDACAGDGTGNCCGGFSRYNYAPPARRSA